MSERPRCPVCGKALPKLTCMVWVERGDTPEFQRAMHRNMDGPWSRHIHPVIPPRSMADCRKLTNKEVVSVTYHHSGDGTVSRFGEWDGDYWTASRPFCKPDCAVEFARAAYLAGYRLVPRAAPQSAQEGVEP